MIVFLVRGCFKLTIALKWMDNLNYQIYNQRIAKAKCNYHERTEYNLNKVA